jgi:hypothetical protein
MKSFRLNNVYAPTPPPHRGKLCVQNSRLTISLFSYLIHPWHDMYDTGLCNRKAEYTPTTSAICPIARVTSEDPYLGSRLAKSRESLPVGIPNKVLNICAFPDALWQLRRTLPIHDA